MPRGPLPNPSARRRNAPTIPTTDLPAGGRRASNGKRLPPPKLPAGYALAELGRAWWRWAWSTPQAAAWNAGDLYALARRARLEDDVAALREPPHAELKALVAELVVESGARRDVEKVVGQLCDVISVLQGLAGHRSTIDSEMRQLEDRLGLTPKGMAQLRWRIVAEETRPASTPGPESEPKQSRSRSRHLHVADPATAAG